MADGDRTTQLCLVLRYMFLGSTIKIQDHRTVDRSEGFEGSVTAVIVAIPKSPKTDGCWFRYTGRGSPPP